MTLLTVFGKDGSRRIVRLMTGRWNADSLRDLAQDLEAGNYFAHSAKFM
jgi:hypothetical protein